MRHKYHITINYTYQTIYEEDCPPGCLDDHINIVKDIANTYSPMSGSIIVPKGLSHWNCVKQDVDVSVD